MILSSVSHPGLEKTAEAARDGFRIFQLYVRGDEAWVDDHVRRAIDQRLRRVLPDRRHRQLFAARARHRQAPPAPPRARRRRAHLSRRGSTGATSRGSSELRHPARSSRASPPPRTPRSRSSTASIASMCRTMAGASSTKGSARSKCCLRSSRRSAGAPRVMVDGGITRGTDVVKAITLGADAVVVGRLYVYGLAAAGGPGVVRLFEILEDEIRICLSLLGVTSLRRARQILYPPGAAGRAAARPQRLPASQSAEGNLLAGSASLPPFGQPLPHAAEGRGRAAGVGRVRGYCRCRACCAGALAIAACTLSGRVKARYSAANSGGNISTINSFSIHTSMTWKGPRLQT